MTFKNIFKTKHPIIGVIHFLPLIGYSNFSKEYILKTALKDLRALEEGGVDGIFIENNYDIPHGITVGPETVAIMTYLGSEIRKRTQLPLGISVLFNDYKAALSIAKTIGAQFVRVPVFVDDVKTNYGDVFGNPQEVIDFRNRIDAKNILLFTDIHVKHAHLVSQYSLEESAKKTKTLGSDGIIVTGKWTGDAPDMKDLQKVRKAIKDFPVLIGSGADKNNVNRLLDYADCIIVSTSLKSGERKKREVNVKGYKQRISLAKTKTFMKLVKGGEKYGRSFQKL